MRTLNTTPDFSLRHDHIDLRICTQPAFSWANSPDIPPEKCFTREQWSAQVIRSLIQKHHDGMTSRSTYVHNDHQIMTMEQHTTKDYRDFVLDKLDADVYTPYRAPGIHWVPYQLADITSKVRVHDIPWVGDCPNKHMLPIQTFKAALRITRKENTVKFECQSEYGSCTMHQPVFELNHLVNFEQVTATRMIERLLTSNLTEVWLCKDDVLMEIMSDSEEKYALTFHYIDIPQPTTTEIRRWKYSVLRKARLSHQEPTRQNPITINGQAESKALRTLRDLISECAYRRYLANGFIMVKGASGLHYQIFADQRKTIVWKDHQAVSKICIHTDRSCPPSDHIINLKHIIELDEQALWLGGNVSGAKYDQLLNPQTNLLLRA